MKKRLLSIILTAFLVLSMVPYAAFADSSIVCPACGGSVTKQERRLLTAHDDFFKCDKCGKWAWANKLGSLNLFSVGDQQILEAADSSGLLNFSFNNGHLISAEKAPSGIGRKDLPGYVDDKGTPTYNSSGSLQFVIEPYCISDALYHSDGFAKSFINPSYYILGSSGSGTKFISTSPGFAYKFTAPVSGIYYLGHNSYDYNAGFLEIYGYDSASHNNVWYRKDFIFNPSTDRYYSITLNKGEVAYFCGDWSWDRCSRSPFKYSLYPLTINIEPLGNSSITTTNNITINNNTWNGNIYTDNSTNLTYIYPQYTTINEKNETVTNISNNPIIYNNETKQYYTYDSVTNNYYYITYVTTPTPTPSPSPAPVPTWTPGGGATRGGGVGRHPSDTDAADWTLHYYILNNRRYDAYYALKKTEVNTETKLPWVDNKKYISTTQIPIANGQYTVSVPDGVYWRVWQWDEASQTLTGVNSSNWHSTINNFLFNATGEYIFEFCKADGSDFNTAKDVTLKLKNDKITEYEPGGALDTEPVTPETQNLIIPKMNSNTFTDEHGTWIASGSSKYSDVFDFFYAFDRSTANFWETNVSPSHLQIEIPDPENYYIDGYIMRISKFTNCYAKEWTLQGSDDGKTWDDLDTQKDQNLSDMQEHKYTLTLRKAYKYYRLNMSNYASSMCSLSHFNLLGYQTKDVVTPSPTPAPTNPPTPTTPPTPGGDNPGGSGSGSGSGDNSWNPFKWLTDLLKDLIEDILKGLWKLLTSIFGFILWLLSLLFKLFPWMPNSGILALCAGVVVVTVIRIIKFITGR